MSHTFDQQTAVITGAGSGIGFALAQHLAQQSASVVLNDIVPDRAASAASRIRDAGGHCIAVPGDARDVAVVYRLVEKAVDTYGRLDLAIANAGCTLFGDFFSCSVEDFQKIVSLNLQGTFFLAQAAAKQMRLQGHGGRILLMSSNIGTQPYPQLAPYCMTKAALNMLARTLVLDLAPHRIAINALAPGATITERTLQDDPDYEHHWQAVIPNHHVARPSDIVDAALFLLSPAAHHINGHTLVVDGGWSSVGHYPVTTSSTVSS